MSSGLRLPWGAGGHVDASNQNQKMRTNRSVYDRSNRAGERQPVRFQDEPCLLFLYDAISAMRERVAASHFGRGCAGSISGRSLGPLSPAPGDCNSPINAFLTLTAVTKW